MYPILRSEELNILFAFCSYAAEKVGVAIFKDQTYHLDLGKDGRLPRFFEENIWRSNEVHALQLRLQTSLICSILARPETCYIKLWAIGYAQYLYEDLHTSLC